MPTSNYNARNQPDYRIEDMGHATPCWIWQKALSHRGYGRCERNRKNYSAHKYYYEKVIGEVPEGLVLDHLCRVRACVNPDHLEPVTNRENLLRGTGTKLNATMVDKIRKRLLEGFSLRAIGAEFGVTGVNIGLIANGSIWKEEK